MKRLLVFILPVFLFSCMNEKEGKVTTVKFNTVEKYLGNDNDTVYIITFWSVDNKVSVSQLPYFDRIRKDYDDEKVKVIPVSLDMAIEKDTRVLPVLKKLGINTDVLLLDDPDTRKWRVKISPLWKGELPATLIYRGNEAEFYQESLNYNKLKSILNGLLKKKD